MKEPKWLTYARSQIGVREIKGARHSDGVMGYVHRSARWLGVNVRDDETPWCGTFVSACMQEAGFEPAHGFIGVRASSWGKWGVAINPPCLGAVLVFTRKGGGHVGFYAGENDTEYYVLGGNQGDAVSFMWLSKALCTAIRWPIGTPIPLTGRVKLKRNGAPVGGTLA